MRCDYLHAFLLLSGIREAVHGNGILQIQFQTVPRWHQLIEIADFDEALQATFFLLFLFGVLFANLRFP